MGMSWEIIAPTTTTLMIQYVGRHTNNKNVLVRRPYEQFPNSVKIFSA